MSTRPHVHTVFRAGLITVDMRVFWGNATDKQLVLSEVFDSYTDLVSRIQAKMDRDEAAAGQRVVHCSDCPTCKKDGALEDGAA